MRYLCFQPAFTLVSCSAYSSTLKVEGICSSETLVDYQRTAQRYIPEDGTLYNIVTCGGCVTHKTDSQSVSQSYITTDGQSASLSWYQAPIWGLWRVLYWMIEFIDNTRTEQKTQFPTTPIVLCLPIRYLETGSFIVAFVFVAAGMCLLIRFIAVDVSSDFTNPTFWRHVTISVCIWPCFSL
jgi:hypothetical protein